MSFHIESIPNQANKPAILLRQAWREGRRVRKKTLANLSKLPPDVIDGFRAVLKGGLAVADPSDLLHVERSWTPGHSSRSRVSVRLPCLSRITGAKGGPKGDCQQHEQGRRSAASLLILIVAALGVVYLPWVFWSMWDVFLGLTAVAVFLVGLARCLECFGQPEGVCDSKRWWQRLRGALCVVRASLSTASGSMSFLL